jgi:signal transduction histidine kinase
MMDNTEMPPLAAAGAPSTSIRVRALQRTLLAAVIWTLVGVVFALPLISASGQWRIPLLASLAQWWSWGLLAPAIVSVDLKLPFTTRQVLLRILTHLVLCPIFTAIYLYLFAAVDALLRLAPWSRLLSAQLLIDALHGMFLWSALVYCLIIGVFQAYLYHHRYLSGQLHLERLERSFSEARLNALRMQLDPHFLFNALNTISSQLERDPRLARRMIEHLGDLLRLSLASKDRQEVPLAEELAFLEHYLAIQRIRFGDTLKVELSMAPEVRYASVPSLLLQPLVENAIRHGISRRAAGGAVLITAAAANGQLDIRVLDDGIGLPSHWTLASSSGLGLSVTRERILGLHPDAHFAVNRRRGGGTEVEITLPLRVIEEALDPLPS